MASWLGSYVVHAKPARAAAAEAREDADRRVEAAQRDAGWFSQLQVGWD